MRIAFITAGAAGMFCGSCMRDNALVSALIERGHDALLIPTYTPIRTDDPDASQNRVFFGGINVFLQQKSRLFRHTPRLFDRLLDFPRLLKWVSRFASRTPYNVLGKLTVSMLQGQDGNQRKELQKLIDWLKTEIQPEVIILTNVLLSGIAPQLRAELNVPILATLQGDDIFLEALPEPDRKICLELIRTNSESFDGFISTSEFYANDMAKYLQIDRAKIRIVYPGISLRGHGGTRPSAPVSALRIGYFARICPEKGFHNLIDAFIHLRKTPSSPPYALRASGWLGENHRAYFAEQMKELETAGLRDQFEYVESPDHSSKVRFLNSIDVLSVPTVYHEPKGLYLLEAWANGVPVVQPAHGSFPELIELTGAGLLVKPNDPLALAIGLRRLLEDVALRETMAQKGRDAVAMRFHAGAMAEQTEQLLNEYVRSQKPFIA